MQVSHKNNNNNKHNNKNRETVLELLGRYWIVVGVNDLQPMSKANGANALRTSPSPFWAKRKINQSGCCLTTISNCTKPWQHITTTLLHLHWHPIKSQLQNPLSHLQIPSEPLQSS